MEMATALEYLIRHSSPAAEADHKPSHQRQPPGLTPSGFVRTLEIVTGCVSRFSHLLTRGHCSFWQPSFLTRHLVLNLDEGEATSVKWTVLWKDSQGGSSPPLPAFQVPSGRECIAWGKRILGAKSRELNPHTIWSRIPFLPLYNRTGSSPKTRHLCDFGIPTKRGTTSGERGK